MYHMDLYLDRDFIPLLEDSEVIIHYSNLVENKQTALDKHIANLVNLKAKFFEDSILKSTPDMPYSMYIDMDYNNAKIISKKWIDLRENFIGPMDPKHKASINNNRPYNYKRIR